MDDTLDQSRNFFAGFQVGFYHDPKIDLSPRCLDQTISKDAEFVLNLVYGQENIMHFLDIVKFSTKSVLVIQNAFENCGYKQIVTDIHTFCTGDK